MSPSSPPTGGDSPPKHSTTPIANLSPVNFVDLTLDSDDDEISEISCAQLIEPNVVIKKEREESVGLTNEILDIPREVEEEVVQSAMEEGTSTSPVASANLRVNPLSNPEEVPIPEVLASTDTTCTFTPTKPLAPLPLSREEVIARDRALEQLLQDGYIIPPATEDPNHLSTTPHQPNNSNEPPQHIRIQPHISDGNEDAASKTEFLKFKKHYEARKQRGQTSFSEEVEYEKACHAEEDRIRLLQRKKRVFAEQEAQANDETLFCSDIEQSPRDERTDLPIISSGEDAQSSKEIKRNRGNKIPLSALQESMRVGFEAGKSRGKKKSGKERRQNERSKKVSIDKVAKSKKTKDKAHKKRGRPRKGPEITNLGSLLNHDFVAEAQANQDKPSAPGFTSYVRKDALKELIASMPTDQQKLYTADKAAINKACQNFSNAHSIKPKGSSGWQLKGMRSYLEHYQLLGTAFMRERENRNARPYGGIQSDEMGLGKTVMMIANILDGKASDRSPNRTTLIVCPPALTTQWLNEIEKHTEPGAFREVLVHRAGTRIMSSDTAKTLSNADVVITTYQEVLRSYPACQAPLHLVTEKAKEEWWADHYEKERGVLHKIFWRRIVLDEGHLIKNHMSKTSIAVRGLSGKYRWAITGTPIQNSLEEFYPYFAFLKVEHTGTFETFKRNFCKRGSTVAMERLKVFLQSIMVRRTHVDQMFGRPILKLPKIDQQTVEVEFNDVERAIYRIVKTRFINRINAFGKADSIHKNYQQIFTLLLRLRQLTGHVLLIAKTLKELLAAEDLERLWKLTDREEETAEGNRNVLLTLHQGPEQQEEQQTRPAYEPAPQQIEQQTRPAYEPAPQPVELAITVENDPAGPSFRFRKYLRSLREDGRWEKIAQISLCHHCDSIPKNPYITSCMHIYCQECLESIQYSAAQQEQLKAKCKECGTEYEKVEPCRGFGEAAQEDGSPVSIRSAGKKRKKFGADGEDDDIDWFTVGGPILRSAKTKAAEAQIEAWLADDPEAKIIVFTQFIGMIKIMSRICAERQWGCTLFHGGMSLDSRDAALKQFSEDPKIQVMATSWRAGGIGLNLTAASRVIIIDLWFNQSAEQQSFARVYRIGQTRDVELRRFVVKDSVDFDILKMQERKNNEISAVTERRTTKLTTTEMLRLFGPLAADEGGEITAEGEDEPFIFVEDHFEQNDSDSDIEEIPRTIPARPF